MHADQGPVSANIVPPSERGAVWAAGCVDSATRIWRFAGIRFEHIRDLEHEARGPEDMWGTSANGRWLSTSSRLVHFDGEKRVDVPLPATSIRGGDLVLNSIWGSAKDDI